MDVLEELKRETALAAQKQYGSHEELKKTARAKLNEALKYYTELFNLLKVEPLMESNLNVDVDGEAVTVWQIGIAVKQGACMLQAGS